MTEAADRDGLRLSVVLVAHDMPRELPRMIRSLSPAMQRDIDATEYELMVVDNRSSEPPDRAACEGLGTRIRWLRIDDAPPSPAGAVNRGIAAASAPIVGVMIDGARLASPGILHHALLGARGDADLDPHTFDFSACSSPRAAICSPSRTAPEPGPA